MLADDALGAARETYAQPLPHVYRQAFAAVARSPDNWLYVVSTGDDRALGCLQLTLTPGLSRRGMTRATIESVRIAREARSQGLGEGLLRYAIEQARAKGCALVQLTSDTQRPEALRFYERLGFRASHVGLKLSLDTEQTP